MRPDPRDRPHRRHPQAVRSASRSFDSVTHRAPLKNASGRTRLTPRLYPQDIAISTACIHICSSSHHTPPVVGPQQPDPKPHVPACDHGRPRSQQPPSHQGPDHRPHPQTTTEYADCSTQRHRTPTEPPPPTTSQPVSSSGPGLTATGPSRSGRRHDYCRVFDEIRAPLRELADLRTMETVRSTALRTGTIVSTGYEGRSIDDFVRAMKRHRVELVVDVRLNAVSRKRGFSKTALTEALATEGIGYRHETELGNPPENRDAFRAGWATAQDRYRRHLENGAASRLQAITDLVAHTRIALLCFEREHTECHRSCITDKIKGEYPAVSVVKV